MFADVEQCFRGVGGTRFRSASRGAVMENHHDLVSKRQGREDWQWYRKRARQGILQEKDKDRRYFRRYLEVATESTIHHENSQVDFWRWSLTDGLIRPGSPVGEKGQHELELGWEVHWPWWLSRAPFGGAVKVALQGGGCILVNRCWFDLPQQVELNLSRRLKKESYCLSSSLLKISQV